MTVSAHAQSEAVRSPWFVVYRLGWTSFEMSDAKNLMNELVGSYAANGVPIRTQLMFPGNALNGLELVRTNGIIRFGAGCAYSSSVAVASYRDGAGSLRIRNESRAYLMHVFVGLRLFTSNYGSGHAGLKGGAVLGKVSTEDHVQFLDLPELDSRRTVDAEGFGYFWELNAGCESTLFDLVSLGAEAGYRIARKQDVSLWADSNVHPADFSGWSFSVSVGVALTDVW